MADQDSTSQTGIEKIKKLDEQITEIDKQIGQLKAEEAKLIKK